VWLPAELNCAQLLVSSDAPVQTLPPCFDEVLLEAPPQQGTSTACRLVYRRSGELALMEDAVQEMSHWSPCQLCHGQIHCPVDVGSGGGLASSPASHKAHRKYYRLGN